ncbi:hypothetical protein [Rubrobacter marinus]|nr:hypothetical protein [Rubrobacter marinus]
MTAAAIEAEGLTSYYRNRSGIVGLTFEVERARSSASWWRSRR